MTAAIAVPARIQRRRTAGWRMPEGAVYVGRPTRWGNPYVVHQHGEQCGEELLDCPEQPADNPAAATRLFRHAVLYPLIGQPRVPTPDEIREELAGHDLVCWCPLEDAQGNRVPCHADVLLEIANSEATP